METKILKELRYELSEKNIISLNPIKYQLPEDILIPSKYWGTIISNKEFIISGIDINEIK